MNIILFNPRTKSFTSDPKFIRSKLNAEQLSQFNLVLQSFSCVLTIQDLAETPGGFRSVCIHGLELWFTSLGEDQQLYFLPVDINKLTVNKSKSIPDLLTTTYVSKNAVLIFGSFTQEQIEVWVSKNIYKSQSYYGS